MKIVLDLKICVTNGSYINNDPLKAPICFIFKVPPYIGDFFLEFTFGISQLHNSYQIAAKMCHLLFRVFVFVHVVVEWLVCIFLNRSIHFNLLLI